MGRRPNISKEAIWAAADQIESKGGYASQAEIRKVLGSGSYTTIAAAMDERKKLPRSRIDLPLSAPMPNGLSERYKELGEDVWSAALLHAYEALRPRILSLEEELRNAKETIEKQKDQIERIKSKK